MAVDWSTIFSPQAFARAWQQTQAYWTQEDIYLDRLPRLLFSYLLQANFKLLSQEMSTRPHQYEPGPVWRMTVPKKGGQRVKDWPYPEDDLIAQAVLNAIGVPIDQQFSRNSYGYRLESSEQAGDRIFERWQERYNQYRSDIQKFAALPPDYHYITTDISGFYPSIRHDHLLASISKVVDDVDMLSLLRKLIRFKWRLTERPDVTIDQEVGLSQGPAYARFLANLYLSDVDTWLGTNTVGFARYVDDMCLIFDGKEAADAGLQGLTNSLGQFGLSLSRDKTTGPTPLSDPSGLIATVRQLWYEAGQAFEGIDALPLDDPESLATHLRRHFRTVGGKAEDLAQAAQRVSLIFKATRKVLAPGSKQFEEILPEVYTVLRAGPIKAATLRGLFTALIEHFRGELPNELIAIIREGDAYAQVFAIDALITTKTFSQSALQLLRSVAESDGYSTLARAAALDALFAARVNLTPAWIASIAEHAPSFVGVRAVLCYANVPEFNVFDSLARYIRVNDPDMAGACLFVLSERGTMEDALPLLRLVNLASLTRHSLRTLYLFVCLRFGRLSIANPLLLQKPTLLQVLPDLMGTFRSGVLERGWSPLPLLSLLDDAEHLPGETHKDLLRREVEYSLKVVSEAQQQPLMAEARLNHSPWTGIRSHPVLGRRNTGDEKYYVVEREDQSSEVLEVLPKALLDLHALTPGELLEKYLVLPNNVRFEAELAADIPDAESVIIRYKVPPGFQPAMCYLSIRADQCVSLTRRLVEVLTTFSFVPPLDSFRVFLDHTAQGRILGIGGSLGIQSYVTRGAERILEQSGNHHVQFLGFLMFELLTGTCPVATVKELEAQRFKPDQDPLESLSTVTRIRFTDSSSLEPYAHLKWIIRKATLDASMDRYESLNILMYDLEHAASALSGSYATQLSAPGMMALDAAGIRLRHIMHSKNLRHQGSYTHALRIVLAARDALGKAFLGTKSTTWTLKTRLTGPLLRYERLASLAADDVAARLPGPRSQQVWKAVPLAALYFAMRLEVTRLLMFVLNRWTAANQLATWDRLLTRLQSTVTPDSRWRLSAFGRIQLDAAITVADVGQLLSTMRLVRSGQRQELFHAPLKVCATFLLLSACDDLELVVRGEAFSLGKLVPVIPSQYLQDIGSMFGTLPVLEEQAVSGFTLQAEGTSLEEYVSAVRSIASLGPRRRAVGRIINFPSRSTDPVTVGTGSLRERRIIVEPSAIANDPNEFVVLHKPGEGIELDFIEGSNEVCSALVYPEALKVVGGHHFPEGWNERLLLWLHQRNLPIYWVHAFWFLVSIAALFLNWKSALVSMGINVVSGFYANWTGPKRPVTDD